METRKLYYEDPMLRDFTAVVLECAKTKDGWAVILDQTAFYPEGGGQSCDTGTLNHAQVLDVREQDGAVVHLCSESLEVGCAVEGRIHWQRRFDLMQQHTGEHIVSGIIHRRFGLHNVGFHMGADVITIDFDGPIPQEALDEVEQEANQWIWEDLPIRCWYPDPETLKTVPYRTKRELPWPVRIVEIPGVDLCACCGVHTRTTGQVGLIKLLSCVKFHQGVRLEMVCGGRALTYLRRIYEQNRLVSQAFSAKPLETGAAAQKIHQALAEERFRFAGVQRQLFSRIAGEYAGKGNTVHFQPELDPGASRELAECIAQACGGLAAVFSGGEERWNVCLCQPGTDLRTLGKQMTQDLKARGGGKTGFFQGCAECSRQEILSFFAEI